MNTIPTILKLATKAAYFTSKHIMTIYSQDFDVEYKADNSPVTQADKEADEVIHQILENSGFPIISEETKQLDYKDRKDWPHFWLVDPLDGTKEFIAKNNDFSINIALISGNKPLYGLICHPTEQIAYLGDVKNQKLWSIDLNLFSADTDWGDIDKYFEILEVEIPNTFEHISISRSHLDDETQAKVDALNNKYQAQTKKRGSALKFVDLIQGEVQLYFRYPSIMEWDIAAGHALALAAGLEFYSLDEHLIAYNSEDLYTQPFITGTKKALSDFNAL